MSRDPIHDKELKNAVLETICDTEGLQEQVSLFLVSGQMKD